MELHSPELARIAELLPLIEARLSLPSAPLGIREAAEFLGVGQKEVYRLAGERLIPGIKVANSWRFCREDLAEWVRFSALEGREITVEELRKFQMQQKVGRSK